MSKYNMTADTTLNKTLAQIYVCLFFTTSGYCLGRQLIALYYAIFHLKKLIREREIRERDNSMNLNYIVKV